MSKNITIKNLAPGCITLVYSSEMEERAGQLVKLLGDRGITNLVVMEDIQSAIIPGRPWIVSYQ